MATIPEAFAIALQHQQAGRLQAAEQIYRQILAVDPNHADAWHLLGVAHFQRDNHLAAIDCIRHAITLNATAFAFHCNLGSVYRALKAWDEAVACYRRALELNHDSAETHYNLGNVLMERGEQDEAAACYGRALELNPGYAEAHNNLGNVFKVREKWDEAIACYRRALALNAGYAEAHNNLGNVFLELGDHDDAVACYRRALELTPHHAKAHYNLGNVFSDRGKWEDAVACYGRALELNPGYAEAYNNLSTALFEQGKSNEAIVCLRRAVELKPDFAEAYNNLGTALQQQGKHDEAIAYYRRALELNPGYCGTISALVFELQQLCRWTEVQEFSQRVISAVDVGADSAIVVPVSPFSFLTLPTATTARQQLQCARQWAIRRLKPPVEPLRNLAVHQPAKAKKRLTIGYLSADFRAHPVGILTAELFEKHDRARFAIMGYSYGADDGSPIRRRLMKAFDRFVDLRYASFAAAAEQIVADEVDILVDLTGYTMGSRTEILVLRPAPIQVNYLGYPATMGASFMDYILVDDFVVPPDQQPYFTEALVHLPGSYYVNDSQREIAQRTPSRTECNLPETGFVFCSFNNNFKITAEVFGAWMRLLRAVPGSVLWLLEGTGLATANLRAEAQARGVAANRLVFAPRIPTAEHLARHRIADLFLDTFPYNAHTTALDALWAGCPVLTTAGETFASRVAGSLLRALGLSELITTSRDEYEALALRLATDARQLADLRSRLRTNRTKSALFDGEQFARNVEKAYETMWARHARGQMPCSFRVSMD